MANTIQHKRSSTSGVAPAASGLSQGELAINIADGKLYTKNNVNSIINLGVTSISGTYVTPSSGNFFNYLAVNGVPVSVSGHSHTSVQQAQSIVTNVFNKTGATIPKFRAVYINGGQGDMPTVQLAIANGEAGSSKTYAVTAEAISHMSSGSVVVAGSLTGLDTDQFNPTAPTGDVNGVMLWLSPTTSGVITTTKPSAPNHTVFIGNIVRTHQNAGVVEVKIQNGFELQELHNVALNGTSDGQFLYYNGPSGLWQANTNIYSIGSNIGIGTNSPGSPLTVVTAGGSGTIGGAAQTQVFQVNDASASDYVNLGHFNCESNLSRGSFMLSNNGTNGAWQDNCLQFFTHGSAYQYGYYGSNASDAGSAIIVTQGSDIQKLQIGNYGYVPIEFFTDNTFRVKIDEDGNVGIGTATPTYKLDVNGSIRSYDGNSDLILGYNSSINQYGLFNIGSVDLYINSSNGTYINAAGGSNISMTDNLYMSSPGGFGLTYDSTASFTIGDELNTILTLKNSNVGLGISTPSAKLHVIGSGIISSGLYLDDQTVNTIASFDTNKKLISLTTATYPSLTELSYVKGVTSGIQNQLNSKIIGIGTSGYLTKWISSSGISSGIIYDNGTNIGINTITPSGSLHVVGTGLFNSSRFSVSSSASPILPSSVLHINGQVSSFGSLIITGQTSSNTILGYGNSDTTPYFAVVNTDLTNATFGWGMFYRGTEGDFRLSRRSGSASWVDCLNIQRSNGNVGIGSGVQATAPAERLVVDGTIRLSDLAGNKIQFYRGGGTADDYTIRYAAGSPYSLQISTSNDSTTQRCVHFGSHTAGTFTGKTSINGWTGAVGINTLTPSGFFDIKGDMYVRSSGVSGGTGKIYFPANNYGADNSLWIGLDTNQNFNLSMGGNSLQMSPNGGNTTLNAFSTNLTIGHAYNANTVAQHVRFTPGGTEVMRMTCSGTIGIGTTTPVGTCRLTIVGSGTTSGTSALNVVDSSNSPLLFVRNDGNVGVGTTSPSTRLQVNGFVSQSANHASAGLTADQTITTGSDTVIQMTDKDDPNNWWNASTYRFLPTVSGYYFISAQVNWKADTGTGQINSQLRKNGTTFCLVQNPQVSGVTLTQVLTGIVNLNGSTDYIDLTGYSSATDGSQLVTGTSDQAWTKLDAFKIS